MLTYEEITHSRVAGTYGGITPPWQFTLKRKKKKKRNNAPQLARPTM
jgi:hypothetical protein